MSEGVSGVSSGGSLSMVGGIVGTFFGGPVGGMVGSAAGGLLQECVGDAAGDASTQLQREDGMPSFIADQVKQAIEKVLQELLPNGIDPADRREAQDQFGPALDEFTRDLVQKIVDAVRRELGQAGEGGEAAAGKGAEAAAGKGAEAAAGKGAEAAAGKGAEAAAGKGAEAAAGKGAEAAAGKGAEAAHGGEAAASTPASALEGAASQGPVSGDSWLMAIAKAMGSVMGDKASDLVKLSKQMQSAQASGEAGANQAQQATAQLQATSQEFKMLQEAFSTVIKSMGESVAAMAKKN